MPIVPPCFKLTPQRIFIEAPCPLVWEVITSVGRGQLPGSKNRANLIERKDNALIVEFVSHSGNKTYTTLEEMTLYPPDRIEYRHLSGPLPYVWEQIKLREMGMSEAGARTILLYQGQFSTGSILGYVLGPFYIRPLFDRLVREHLAEIKRAAEARAERTIKYARRA